MVSIQKSRGYSLEHYCVLTLEYNGFHVKRNALSYGIEDVVAVGKGVTLFIQVKNTQAGRHSLNRVEQLILKKHALVASAIPIYLFSENRERHWVNLLTNDYYDGIKKYTKEWYMKRQATKKALRELNRKSRSSYCRYVLENWDAVKNFIC
jgi:Holliday junction resolvase